MKRIFLISTIFLAAVVIFVIVILTSLFKSPARLGSEKVSFEVKSGETSSVVGQNLAQLKLINSPLLFKIYTRLSSQGEQIKAGRYQLAGNLTMPQVLDALSRGPDSLRITLVEGWRREEMASAFAQTVESATGYQDFLTASQGLEGFLFPDTYFVPQDVAAKNLVTLMQKTLEEKITPEMRAAFSAKNLSLSQAITLASLIEREAVTASDRALVAGVLFNRLDSGWPLDIDASVQYAVSSNRCAGQTVCDWWPQNLSSADLKIVSPYNTYTVQGLPPTPICSPGLSALEAVANPTKSDYYFYISDADGNLHFAETLEAHNANVAKYL